MMKKFLTVAITLVVLASLVCMMPVSAASPSLVAKANTPTLDGKIDAGEYGPEYVVNDLPGDKWTGSADVPTDVTYAFAWDSKGLYIGVKGYVDGMNPQFNANPKNAIQSGKQGLFFSLNWPGAGNVRVHNWATKAGNEADGAGKDIPNAQRIMKDGVMEAFIPVEAFRINDLTEDVAFTANYEIPAVIVAVGPGNAWSKFGAEGWTGTWTVEGINFGTLKLEAAPATNTGDFGIIALAFVALSSIAAKKRKDA